MLKNLGKNKVLWLLTSIFVLIASSIGVAYQGIYSNVVIPKVIPGLLTQDLLAVAISIFATALITFTKEQDTKKQAIIFGFLGFYFYAYGLYVIEQAYTSLYLLYMAIFGLSVYSMLYGVASIRWEKLAKLELSKLVRIASAAYCLVPPAIFYPLWLSQLIPLIQTGTRLENLFSVYILDLCFIMPLFIILAIMTLKNRGLGLFLTPSLFVVGFTVLFPLVLAEVLKPIIYNSIPDLGSLVMFLILSLIFVVLSAVYLLKLKEKE